MFVPAILHTRAAFCLQIDQPAVMGTITPRRDQSIFGTGRGDGLPGSLQAGLDLAQHRENFRRVGFFKQNHLALLHREGVGTDVKISLGQAPGGLEGIGRTANLLVSFLEDFERLIIVRLCLSYDLKHFNRLNDLTMLLLG